jgi:hypothetical protein
MTTLHHDREEEKYLLGTRFGMRSDQDVEIKITSQRKNLSTKYFRRKIGQQYLHLLRKLRFNLPYPPTRHPCRFQSGKTHDMLEECHNDCDVGKIKFHCTNHVFLHGFQYSNDDDADDGESRKQSTALWMTYWKYLLNLFFRASLIHRKNIEWRVEGEMILLPRYRSYVDQDDDHHCSLHYRKKGKRALSRQNQNKLVMLCLSSHVPTSDTPMESDDDCYKAVSGIYNLDDDSPSLFSSSRDEEQTLDVKMKKTKAATFVKSSSTTTTIMLQTTSKTIPQNENVDVTRKTLLPSLYSPNDHLYATTAFTRIRNSKKKERAVSSISSKHSCDNNKESEIYNLHQYSPVIHHDAKTWNNTKVQCNLSKQTTSEVSTQLHKMELNHVHQNHQQQYFNSENTFDNNILNQVSYPSIYISTEESIVSDITIMTDDSNQDGYEKNNKKYQRKFRVPNLYLYPYDEPL